MSGDRATDAFGQYSIEQLETMLGQAHSPEAEDAIAAELTVRYHDEIYLGRGDKPRSAGPSPQVVKIAGQVYAGFRQRLAALLVDGAVLAIAAIALYVVLPIEDLEGLSRDGATVGFLLLTVVAGWLYAAGFESSVWQATPGKMALGLVVTDLTTRRISFGRATRRFFAKLLSTLPLLLGFVMATVTRRKQALHDRIAGTLVLRKTRS